MCNEAYRLLAFYNSNESSVSTHICKLPTRYNLAYSSGSSTASEVNAQSDPGVVFALEPKIVLPGVGPLGIENSWVVTADGVEKLTLCKEEIIEM